MHVLAILAADDNGGGGAAGFAQIGILLLIPLAMYFLMIRPQRRKMRDQQAMQSSLEVGDEVMTGSGIYGFITGFEDEVVWVEIDDDVQIRVNRGFLQGKVKTATDASAATSTSTATTPVAPATSNRITPSVKGVKGGKGGPDRSKPDSTASADTASDAEAEPTTQE